MTDLFPSLADCLDHVQAEYPQEIERVRAHLFGSDEGGPVETGTTGEASLPRFLFRGEGGQYPSTFSSLERLALDEAMPAYAVADVIRARLIVVSWLVNQLKIPKRLAEGFVQHYGLPTLFLDLTSELSVAASFAASPLDPGDEGVIGVFRLESLSAAAEVVDLSGFALAARAQRQHAFAMSPSEHRDIKSLEWAEVGVHWHAFSFSAEDSRRFSRDAALLDASTDPVAGWIQLSLNGMRKISDPAARWIADRVPPAPVVGRSSDSDSELESDDVKVPEHLTLIPTREIGFPWDETLERERNYRRWSAAFPDEISIAPLAFEAPDELSP